MNPFHASVSTLKGVGSVKQKALLKMNIRTLEDLIYCFPRDYEDRRNRLPIARLTPGSAAVVRAAVVSYERLSNSRNGKSQLELTVKDDTGVLKILFFNASYVAKVFEQGGEFFFYGKIVGGFKEIKMLHPDFSKADEGEGRDILPVYPLTAGISQKDMRKWMESLLPMIAYIDEYLPPASIERNRICGIAYALENIHFPTTRQKFKEARYRLVFEELLLLYTGLKTAKMARINESGIAFERDVDMEAFKKALPFRLTEAQSRVLSEICLDMESAGTMNRLIQGDVGSGKTAVAAAAIYKAVKSGFQTVMMAPTETLAKQHYNDFTELFGGLGMKVGFLSGNLKASERIAALEDLCSGETDILIGTHALIQPDVIFARLGLVITDEQHRFGVSQRIRLSQKGKSPDILVMTATPIPRTLGFIIYGDLDISSIDERPPGRLPVITKAVRGNKRNAAYEFVRKEVGLGNQAYIVAPSIDENEGSDLKSAAGIYEELQSRFREFSVAMIHGRMKQSDKDKIMGDFAAGQIQVLVSTVLIEVGINVPTATIMLVENAERFGLAQLHQLRGRVGRGKRQSCCILICENDSEDARERINIMLASDDGFKIAEKDLELRGPGEFFGMKQHGIPGMRMANLLKHVKVLNAVKEETAALLAEDPELLKLENNNFAKKIESMFISAGEIGI
ncbi:MAG: ATP-dependent DNA helicase RecG [Clostridiales Family XIII bacterium]|jgi:ATP-dependent DNA helicase RecG|nr:ATP-dependent DNA helicase RecG [Clostridiales Family XIII bacterium]